MGYRGKLRDRIIVPLQPTPLLKWTIHELIARAGGPQWDTDTALKMTRQGKAAITSTRAAHVSTNIVLK